MIVSLEIAKLLKKLGFDINCKVCYNSKGEKEQSFDYINDYFESEDIKQAEENTGEPHYLAPTYYEVQKWLRTHNIHVNPIISYSTPQMGGTFMKGYACTVEVFSDKGKCLGNWTKGITKRKTYEESLEQGILEGLKHVK